MKRFTGLLLVLLFGLGACSISGDHGESKLTVFAAASLMDAFADMGEAFTDANPDVAVQFNFAGSQQLAQQLLQGAPADVFASANPQQMELVAQAGMAADPVPFAGNRLVVVVPRDNPGAVSSVSDLARPGLRLVLADERVPAGRYTLELLARLARQSDLPEAFAAKVTANVASFEQNVRAVLTKVALGEADAGFVYMTDAAAAQGDVLTVELPEAVGVVARYEIAAMTESEEQAAARRFVDFVRSPRGQSILKEHGFLPANS